MGPGAQKSYGLTRQDIAVGGQADLLAELKPPDESGRLPGRTQDTGEPAAREEGSGDRQPGAAWRGLEGAQPRPRTRPLHPHYRQGHARPPPVQRPQWPPR